MYEDFLGDSCGILVFGIAEWVNVECFVWNVECGMWSVSCGVWSTTTTIEVVRW